MVLDTTHRLAALAKYAAFNGVMSLCAALALVEVMRLSVVFQPEPGVTAAEPSRVEQFKRDELAAARAPQEPVPRILSALSVPDMPVQVLAVRLDRAESLKATPIKLKRKPQLKTAKALRAKKPALIASGKLPLSAVEIALSETGVQMSKKPKKTAVVAESSRDITNRSLGVLVALNN